MKQRKATDRGAVDIIEEAVHLLRSAPASLYVPYLTGMIPFCLALLWFTAEMTWSAFASEWLVEESLALALLYIWKQVWDAVFCARIHERVTGASEPWTRQRIWRMVTLQSAIQPLALLLLPLTAVLMVPFATAVAYFRNLSLYASFGSAHALRLSREQSMQWTRQNWIIQSLLSILALLLLLNYLVALMILPQLAKSFFGMDNDVTRYPMWLLTSTGFAGVGILVYVTLDPLVSAIYVLRCFYGQSIQTGADVRARLHRIAAVAMLVCCLLVIPAGPVLAQQQEPPPAAAKPDARSEQIGKSIESVLRRREFTWRMPKKEDDGKKRPGWATWIDALFARIGEFWEWFWEGIRKWFEPDNRQAQPGEKADPWAATLKYSLWILGAVFAIAAAVVLYRQRQARKLATTVAAAIPSVALDLRDESVTADKLPESSWLALAQEWIDKGDLRLALRAMHLAGLSYLNGRSLVTIQRWKSGMEYSAEISRRGRSVPELGSTFKQNLRIFEAGWYGRHEVSAESLEKFSKGLDEVRSHAGRL
jgi:hypothetical protein